MGGEGVGSWLGETERKRVCGIEQTWERTDVHTKSSSLAVLFGFQLALRHPLGYY